MNTPNRYMLVDEAGGNQPATKRKLNVAILLGAVAGFTFTLVLIAAHLFFHH